MAYQMLAGHIPIQSGPHSAWPNKIELVFEFTRSGAYSYVQCLRDDVRDFINDHNANPRPFRWTIRPGMRVSMLSRLLGSFVRGSLDLWEHDRI